MHRRDFAKTALFGAAVAAMTPGLGRAAGANENVLFSDEDPGHWAGKAALHVPVVDVSGGQLTVKTPHPQSAEHFIVSHTVVLGDGTYLSRKTFAYTDAPVSEHMLPAGYTGAVRVTSTCNLHDIWVKTISV